MEYLGNCTRKGDFKLFLHRFYQDIYQLNKSAACQMLMHFKAFYKKVSFDVDLQKSLRGYFLFSSNGENIDPQRVKGKPMISVTDQSQISK